jgi:hypothetical protein
MNRVTRPPGRRGGSHQTGISFGAESRIGDPSATLDRLCHGCLKIGHPNSWDVLSRCTAASVA